MNYDKKHPYPCLARLAVSTYLDKNQALSSLPALVSVEQEIWLPRAGCFVSIKNRDGELRGCIGTLAPCEDNLGLEIINNAIAAASRDPRFAPVQKSELPGLVFSVDVLSAPEPVLDTGMLDTKKWGVIVSKDGRRGVLLPDLEGVDSVEKQLAIAAQKAGITQRKGMLVERFSVSRYAE